MVCGRGVGTAAGGSSAAAVERVSREMHVAIELGSFEVRTQRFQSQRSLSQLEQEAQPPSTAGISGYEGKLVRSIEISGVAEREREHILQLLPQKVGGTAGSRDGSRQHSRAVRDRPLCRHPGGSYARRARASSLTFTTSPNFFVGAVDVEGAPARPTSNQIVNASKLQLGELYTQEKLERALENIRQLMQENGYYRARVTAESVSNPSTQQVDILFHISRGEQAQSRAR